jgi:hypothetical protein
VSGQTNIRFIVQTFTGFVISDRGYTYNCFESKVLVVIIFHNKLIENIAKLPQLREIITDQLMLAAQA